MKKSIKSGINIFIGIITLGLVIYVLSIGIRTYLAYQHLENPKSSLDASEFKVEMEKCSELDLIMNRIDYQIYSYLSAIKNRRDGIWIGEIKENFENFPRRYILELKEELYRLECPDSEEVIYELDGILNSNEFMRNSELQISDSVDFARVIPQISSAYYEFNRLTEEIGRR